MSPIIGVGSTDSIRVKSPFRYPGGKSKASVLAQIMRFAPKDLSEYREPFVGGGGVFFGLEKQCRSWINDINMGLVAVYKALRDRPKEFIWVEPKE